MADYMTPEEERLVALTEERDELTNKVIALTRFISQDLYDGYYKHLLDDQLSAMEHYLTAVNARLEIIKN